MIKAEDLRIGDLVNFHNSPCIITGIDDISCTVGLLNSYNSEDFRRVDDINIEPIPLTPEILEKNGWKKRTEGWYFMMISKYMYLSVEFGYENGIRVFLKRTTDGIYVKLNIANNVHELQHILWALGKDANLKI